MCPAIDLGRRGEADAILRPLRPGDARLDRAHVEFQHIGVVGLGRAVFPEQALCFGVGLDQRDLLLTSARQTQVAQALGIDREDAAGGAVLRRHVADGGPIRERQGRKTVAEELDELTDHTSLAQHLHHGQHEVGCRRAFCQLAGQPEADHLRDQHHHRLAEHRRLGLDAADAPAEHADAVDHRRVRVRANHCIREGSGLAFVFLGEHDTRQILQIDLVHDTGVRRHDLEVRERALAPAQEFVALLIALVLDVRVQLARVRAAEVVNLHRVVDDQLHRRQRIDLVRIAADLTHRLAHRGKIHYRRDACEVLQQHAARRERDLGRRLSPGIPVRQRLDICSRDVHTVLVAQQVLEQDLERVGQAAHVMLRRQRVQAEYLVLVRSDLQGRAGVEAVGHGESRVTVVRSGIVWNEDI